MCHNWCLPRFFELCSDSRFADLLLQLQAIVEAGMTRPSMEPLSEGATWYHCSLELQLRVQTKSSHPAGFARSSSAIVLGLHGHIGVLRCSFQTVFTHPPGFLLSAGTGQRHVIQASVFYMSQSCSACMHCCCAGKEKQHLCISSEVVV